MRKWNVSKRIELYHAIYTQICILSTIAKIKTRIATLLLDNVDYKARKITKNKEECFTLKIVLKCNTAKAY